MAKRYWASRGVRPGTTLTPARSARTPKPCRSLICRRVLQVPLGGQGALLNRVVASGPPRVRLRQAERAERRHDRATQHPAGAISHGLPFSTQSVGSPIMTGSSASQNLPQNPFPRFLASSVTGGRAQTPSAPPNAELSSETFVVTLPRRSRCLSFSSRSVSSATLASSWSSLLRICGSMARPHVAGSELAERLSLPGSPLRPGSVWLSAAISSTRRWSYSFA